MKLNIRPLRNDIRDCIEDMIISVVSWWGRGHELMFTKSWIFDFLIDQPELPLSERIVFSEDHPDWKMLEKYHGIQLTEVFSKSPEEYLELVKKELANQRPVLVEIDCFWCPWQYHRYQKEHAVHFTLAVGFDEEQDELIFIDSIPLIEDARLPVDEFLKGVISCTTFGIVGEEVTDPDWRQILIESAQQMKGAPGSVDAFTKMRYFADELSRSLDLAAEVEGYEEALWMAPFFSQVMIIERSHRKFGHMLKVLGEKINNAHLLKASTEVEKLGLQWSSVTGMLVKSYYLNDSTELLERTVNKIYQLAIEEEQLAEKLLHYAEEEKIEEITQTIESVEPHRTGQVSFVQVDLTPYFNNHGVGDSLDLNCTANLTETGAYLLQDEKMLNSEWRVDQIPFRFPTVGADVQDNISCASQQIPVPSGEYQQIQVLGCGEWGNHSEKIQLEYKDGFIETVPLELTDWFFEPSFGEEVAWTGFGAERTKISVEKTTVPVRLFMQKIKLQHQGELVAIRLCDLPNIHIFAITLEKWAIGSK